MSKGLILNENNLTDLPSNIKFDNIKILKPQHLRCIPKNISRHFLVHVAFAHFKVYTLNFFVFSPALLCDECERQKEWITYTREYSTLHYSLSSKPA